MMHNMEPNVHIESSQTSHSHAGTPQWAKSYTSRSRCVLHQHPICTISRPSQHHNTYLKALKLLRASRPAPYKLSYIRTRRHIYETRQTT